MKKVLSAVLSAVLMCSPVATVQAKVGDVVGKAYNTDIVAYINHYAIPSYAVNGTSCIVAEDLRNFGFDVEWDNSSRSLTLKRNNQTQIHEMNFRKEAAPSSEFADLLETDISVYADGTKLTSYAINGYTFIPLEELKIFGECYWVAEERALKMWIDGISMRSAKHNISQYVAPIKTYNITSYSSDSEWIGSTVYVTPSGKRYHYSSSCAGKNATSSTLSNAKSRGLTACKKCAQ